MANRILRDWTDSENIDKLSFQAEVLFTRLFMKADDYGCFHANPKLLKAALFPLKDIREADLTRWMDECQKAGLIAFYDEGGKKYLFIKNFGQRLRAMKRRFPEPDSNPRSNDSSSPLETKRNETETEKETETIIRIGNEKFNKPCSEIFLNEYRRNYEALMMGVLRGVNATELLAAMDHKYPMYEFRDVNHFQNSLRLLGENLVSIDKPKIDLQTELKRKHGITN